MALGSFDAQGKASPLSLLAVRPVGVSPPEKERKNFWERQVVLRCPGPYYRYKQDCDKNLNLENGKKIFRKKHFIAAAACLKIDLGTSGPPRYRTTFFCLRGQVVFGGQPSSFQELENHHTD